MFWHVADSAVTSQWNPADFTESPFEGFDPAEGGRYLKSFY